jgi:hypothetical protein
MNRAWATCMEFPSDYPASCPPANAELTNGIVYHLVRTPLEDKRNFKSWSELNPKKWKHVCAAHGLSVLRSRAAAFTMTKLSSFRNRGQTSVAIAELDKERGKIAQTGSNPEHYTWWVAKGAPASAGFSIINEQE